jgi:hypothetical protein
MAMVGRTPSADLLYQGGLPQSVTQPLALVWTLIEGYNKMHHTG